MSSSARANAGSLLRNTGIFAIGTFGSKVLVLLVIPLCTHFIDTESMGVYDMAYTVISLLQPIAMMSVSEALFRWMLEETLEKRRVFSTWAPLFGLSLLVFSAVYWTAWAFLRFGDAVLTYLLIVSGCAYASAQFGTRGLRANRLFAVSGVVYSAIYCASTYIFVALLRIGYQGLLLSIFVATALTTALLICLQPELRRVSQDLFDRSLAREMLRYSAFLLPNQLCWWALSWLGRIFIVGFLGYSANGVYSVAMKFPSALSMVSNVFLPAWQEQAITLFGKDGSQEYFSKVFHRYVRLFMGVLLPLVPATVAFVRLFMGASYVGSEGLVAILYLGACFSAFSSFMGVLYLCSKDTKGAASTTVVGAVASAIASLALIPILGLVGACVANLAGNLLMFLARVRQTRHYCTISVPWAEMAALAAAAIGVSLAATALADIWQLAILAVACLALMALVNRSSIGWVMDLVKRRAR